jgi:Undecaprenyl-phosphate galactose phosphotransferase WbaP
MDIATGNWQKTPSTESAGTIMSTIPVTQRECAYAPAGPSIQGQHLPSLSAIVVVGADIVGLSLTLGIFLGNASIRQMSVPGSWLHWCQLVPISLLLYWFFETYPGINVSPVDEIRRISLANTCTFVFISVMLALHEAAAIPQLICLLGCVGASVAVLAMRAAVRQVGSKFAWWGHPVVVFGAGEMALALVRKLKSQPHFGLRPVAVVTDQVVLDDIEGVPVWGSEYLDRIAASGVKHAIVAAPELPQSEFAALIQQSGNAFPHLILILDTDLVWKVGAFTRDFMGILGLQVGNNLLNRGARIAKRTIDLVCAVVLTLLLMPLMVLISLLVLGESGFPIFYSHQRLGREGKHFRLWKFRTMAKNSTEILNQCLSNSEEMRREWAAYHKLRSDPRITRVGKWLRKTSLDELPQLWNIIKGEMTLVGPRPIVDAEVSKYQEVYSLYTKITPGLTGIWQVSGRNRTTYAERLAYDTYYVQNWSVWLDIYLLIKTVRVVLTGYGAY